MCTKCGEEFFNDLGYIQAAQYHHERGKLYGK